ncbi:MAG: heme exporter protein CcmD [Chloroflexota bacterium]|nr:heme exporter protein CcmD [Anaerolineae bacterium]HMM29057.1 heme exporter protein CcmD [Aggregatilineaceae bacterium]
MGKFAEYMILGYSAMALILGGMIAWIYLRYRALRREAALVEQMAAEERGDRVHAAVGALESDAQPEQATPGVSGMANPSTTADRVRGG